MKKRISEQIFDQMREKIERGELQGGTRLPSVEQLALQFDASRSAVREAMSALRALRYVDIRQGEGTFVATFDTENFAYQLFEHAALSDRQIREMYDVRKMLEVGGAKLAAVHRTDEDLKKLRQVLQAMKRAIEEETIGEEEDLAFHLTIAEASKNSVLIHFMTSMQEKLTDVLSTTRPVLLETYAVEEALYQEHVFIYEAIEAKRPDIAADAMFYHLTNVERTLQRKEKDES